MTKSLKHEKKLEKPDQTAKIQRRIHHGWATFVSLGYIFNNNKLSVSSKRLVFDSLIPCSTGASIRNENSYSDEKKFYKAMNYSKDHMLMERAMLGVILKYITQHKEKIPDTC